MVDEDDVLEALSNVIDPELGLDFVELGLVYGVEQVHPKMTFTPPWSPDKMSEDAKFALGF